MKATMVPVEKLSIPIVRNINKKYLKLIVESIENNGFAGFIIVDKNYVILDGIYRFLAAKELQIEEVPCIIKDET